jgi:hypothetical protein
MGPLSAPIAPNPDGCVSLQGRLRSVAQLVVTELLGGISSWLRGLAAAHTDRAVHRGGMTLHPRIGLIA